MPLDGETRKNIMSQKTVKVGGKTVVVSKAPKRISPLKNILSSNFKSNEISPTILTSATWRDGDNICVIEKGKISSFMKSKSNTAGFLIQGKLQVINSKNIPKELNDPESDKVTQ